MTVQFAPWGLALAASIVAGAVVCALMVARRDRLALLLPLEAALLALVGYALAEIWFGTHRPDLSIASVAIAFGACAGGYALCAGILPLLPERRERSAELTIGPAVQGTHVVVLSDEEPEQYDPRAVTAALARYAEGDIQLPPEVGRPLIYASERSRYHRAGGSPARATARAVAAALEKRLKREGVALDVSVAFCGGESSLASAVSRIVAAGGRRIVVASLGVAWSRAFAEAFDDLPLGPLATAGVTVERAEPLWPSPHLAVMLAQRTLASIAGDRSTAGVILLSEGDSWEHARSQEAYREQVVFFTQRVRGELVDAGIPASRIRRASLWLGEPDVTEAARHLAAVGARRIVLVPATFACETIATQTDLPYAAGRAQADTGIEVTTVSAWGDDPAVVEALRDVVVGAPPTRAGLA
jgi:protoheme ferro-lyase